jgi:hypothetical protein
MDAIDTIVHVNEAETLEDGRGRDSSIQIDTPSTPDSSDSFTVTTEYKQALEDWARIVNSSDNTFKRKYAGVIWKHLTVWI